MAEPQQPLNDPRLILIDDVRHDPLLFAELLALIGDGEKTAKRMLVLEQEDASFPKELLVKVDAAHAEMLKAQTPLSVGFTPPQRPRRKEGLAAMMDRIQRETKPRWQAPELVEHYLCSNCDGAPDGGHTSDEFCRLTLEETP